jgi:hypothetical protein
MFVPSRSDRRKRRNEVGGSSVTVVLDSRLDRVLFVRCTERLRTRVQLPRALAMVCECSTIRIHHLPCGTSIFHVVSNLSFIISA